MVLVGSFTNLDPLPLVVRDGMVAMGIIGLVSSVSTLGLLLLITHRMIFWRRYYEHPIASNQIFVLIYNLLLADLQQALSFVISFYWLSQNKLVGPSPACFAQGWLVQIGDLASGLWVLAIAVHTFINLVCQRSIRHRTFVIAVVVLWVFCLFLTAIGPILNGGSDFFVPAGAWCWMGVKHETERLYLHYLWIFISQLGSLVIYISVFFFLRIRLANSSNIQNAALSSVSCDTPPTVPYKGNLTTTTIIMSNSLDTFAISRQRIVRTARYMVVYPFAYVFLTLPLATARISSMAGTIPPIVFFPVAGAMMASCGIVDVVLYLTTRKALVRSSVGVKGQSSGLSRFRTHDSRREGRGQSFRLEELRDEEVDDRLPAEIGVPLGGAIVVSKSIVMSADSCEGSGRSQRSDSQQSLVLNKEEVPQRSCLKKGNIRERGN